LQRTKIISDLLISVSKAERQEARLKVRQDSLRLGNVGVIRYRRGALFVTNTSL
jgi:tousled-like kinase